MHEQMSEILSNGVSEIDEQIRQIEAQMALHRPIVNKYEELEFSGDPSYDWRKAEQLAKVMSNLECRVHLLQEVRSGMRDTLDYLHDLKRFEQRIAAQ
jgi:hypothetical protein